MTNYLKKSWLMMFALPVLAGGIMSCSDDDGYSADGSRKTVHY